MCYYLNVQFQGQRVNPAEDRDKWQDPVKTVTIIGFHEMWEIP